MMRSLRLGLALVALCPAVRPVAPTPSPVVLHEQRQNKTDLELSGSIRGVPTGQNRFITYNDLLKFQQVRYTVKDDPNFGKPVELSGVSLETLSFELSSGAGDAMVTAICDDKYRAHYPKQYTQAHQPFLVLRVNGKPPAEWPAGVDGYAMGPYMISHPSFQPSFQVLKHSDEAQVPWGIVRLDFRDEHDVYAAIQPRGAHRQDQTVQEGYTIASQSCFRCHGLESGTKSDVSWYGIRKWAIKDSDWFDAYVVNPKQLDPDSQMAASHQYDEATLRALRAYFATFTEAK